MDTLATASYPRTYGMSPGWKGLVGVTGLAASVAGLFGAPYLVLSQPAEMSAPGLFAALLLMTAAIGAYALYAAFTYSIHLTPDAIEVIEPFFRRKLARADIGGWRLTQAQGFSILTLVPKDGRGRTFRVSLLIRSDEAFEAWFASLPDLNAEEVHASEQKIAHARFSHLPPAEQAKSVGTLRTLARGFVVTSGALCIAGFLPPLQRSVLLSLALIALPGIAIVLVAKYQPLYRFAARRNDHHPDMTLPLIAPGLILMIRVLPTYHTVASRIPILLALVGGVALTMLAARVDPWFRQQRASLALMALFACAYGYGAGLEVNALADLSTPRIYATQVLDKHWSRGKSTSWYLTLAPWGPVAGVRDVQVSGADYQKTREGDALCLAVKSGALAIHWYELTACPKTLP